MGRPGYEPADGGPYAIPLPVLDLPDDVRGAGAASDGRVFGRDRRFGGGGDEPPVAAEPEEARKSAVRRRRSKKKGGRAISRLSAKAVADEYRRTARHLRFLAVELGPDAPPATVEQVAAWVREFRDDFRASDPDNIPPMVAVFGERLRYAARVALSAAGAVVFDPAVHEIKTPDDLNAWIGDRADAAPVPPPAHTPRRPMGEHARKAAASYPPWSSPDILEAAFAVLNGDLRWSRPRSG